MCKRPWRPKCDPLWRPGPPGFFPVFRRPSPPLVTGGKRVTAMSILGVMIDERLSVTEHVDKVLCSCASSMYALKVLRGRGMPTALLHEVTRATMVARLLYASPSWFRFLKAADLHRLENLIRQAKRGNYLSEVFANKRRYIHTLYIHAFGGIFFIHF